MRIKRALSLGILLILLVSAFGIGATNAQGGKDVFVSVMGQDDIPTIDPSLAEDVSGIQAIDMLFPGLTILNETTVLVEPGIASDWTVSEDGLTYTFNIIPEISWVSYDAEAGEVVQVTDADGNPRYVTAEDMVYGIQRSLNPLTLSYYGEVLSVWIQGGSEKIDIEVTEDGGIDEAALEEASANLAVTALDEYTVEITATQETAFLENIFGMWMARPQPSWVIEEFGDFWTEPDNIVSYGPFALSEWLHDESITFVKNPFWAGTEYIPAPALDSVTNLFLEQSAAVANYEAGELDFVSPVSPDDVDRLRVEYADEFGEGPGTCTYYYGFNTEKAPFDNVNARRAFSLAIDRDIVATLRNSGDQPAAVFTRPDMVAAPQQETIEAVQPLLAPADERNALAQEYLATYFEETGTDELPPIELVYNDSETHALIGEVIQQMWNEVLGADVTLASQEWSTYLDLRATDAPQIYRAAWCYDYLDAHNWTYDVFRSDSAQADDGGNEPNWVNEEFDALITEAIALPDTEARRELYGQAEAILSWEDAAIAPIFFYGNTLLKSPSLEAPFTNTGIEAFAKWDLN